MKPNDDALIDGALIGIGFGFLLLGIFIYFMLPISLGSFFGPLVRPFDLMQIIDSFRELGLVFLTIGAVILASGTIREAYQRGKHKN